MVQTNTGFEFLQDAIRSNQPAAPWILGTPSDRLHPSIADYQRSLFNLPEGAIVFLAEPDPIQFLAAFIAAASQPLRLFLCNPDWQTQEWLQLYQIIQPDFILGNPPVPKKTATLTNSIDHLPAQAILIPTGGTSGQLKFAIHTWETLSASVYGFQQYFQLEQINTCCVLPLYHVSGLMQALRSLITGGTIALYPWKQLATGDLPNLNPQQYFLSLVPTQLNRLLTQPTTVDFLQQFQAILLGGAPAWNSLLEDCRSLKLPIATTYGMTETAAQIATLKPHDFLAGHSGCGQVLPHANITIPDSSTPLQIQAQSMMLGYFPLNRPFIPDDLGYFDDRGSLQITGRNSDKIITGGENVFPNEIEALIRSSQLVQDVAVVGIPDQDWGEAIVVAYVANLPTAPQQTLQQQLQQAISSLSKYKHPKHWIAYPSLPRQPNGKLQRQQLTQQLIRQLSNSTHHLEFE